MGEAAEPGAKERPGCSLGKGYLGSPLALAGVFLASPLSFRVGTSLFIVDFNLGEEGPFGQKSWVCAEGPQPTPLAVRSCTLRQMSRAPGAPSAPHLAGVGQNSGFGGRRRKEYHSLA